MKIVFGILLIIHGLIHLMGFTKAFFTSKMSIQALGISKPIGAIWLVAFVLFILSVTLFFNNNKWFYLAFVAVCISQILIILAWKEAKFGSIANAVILLVGITHFSHFRFNMMVQKESVLLFEKIEKNNDNVASEKDVIHLPEIVQKWMKNSGVIGSPKINSVRLQQEGQLKINQMANGYHLKQNNISILVSHLLFGQLKSKIVVCFIYWVEINLMREMLKCSLKLGVLFQWLIPLIILKLILGVCNVF